MELLRSQTSAMCQFCEESTDIQCKCINCDLFLCQKCNNRIHSRNENFRNHEVISLNEYGTEDGIEMIRKLDLQKLKCSNHNAQNCCVYCAECERPICAQCLAQSHHSHTFIPLENVYKAKIDAIKDMKTKIEFNLALFSKEEENLRQLLLDGNEIVTDTKNEILDHVKKIQKTIAKYAEEIIQEFEDQWKQSKTEFKKELYEIMGAKDDLEERKSRINQTLISHQASEILTAGNLLNTRFPKKSLKRIELKMSKFIPTQTTTQSRSEIFGELYKVPEFELVQTYQTEFINLTNILFLNDNTALLSSNVNETLQTVQLKNAKMKVEKAVMEYVYDMTIMPNGNILFSSNESDLKLCSNNNIHVTKFHSFSTLLTLGVHVNQHGDIIVGLTDSLPISKPTKNSVRKVIVLNQNGDLQHDFEFDGDNQRLLTWPRRICTINENICVLDILNDKWEGKIVTLNKGGQIQWVYKGYISIDNSIFKPSAMAISKTNFIVIPDYASHALHVLSQKGDLIVYTAVKDLGVELPFSLNIDNKNMLWISSTTYGNDKAKLYCLKISQ